MNTSNQSLRDRWIEALESGVYPQVKGTLKGINENDEMGYCCLGVLMSAVLEDEPRECQEYWDGAPDDEGDYSKYKMLKGIVPFAVYEAGMVMNDSGKSFEEIAQMIKGEWID